MSSIFSRIRKNRLSQGSFKLTNENSTPPRSPRENYETAVTGPKLSIETIDGAERKISVGENALPTTPPKSPPRKMEHVDASDFRKFYDTIPEDVRNIDTLEPTRSISEASIRTTRSIRSDSSSSRQTQTTQLETATTNTPLSSQTSQPDVTDTSWREEFSEDFDAIAVPPPGGNAIHSRLCAFYLKKTFDLGDRGQWSEALTILEKAIQHGYTRGNKVKSLVKIGQRDQLSARAMQAVVEDDKLEVERLIQDLHLLGCVDDVKKIREYEATCIVRRMKDDLLDTLVSGKWDAARDYLKILEKLGLSKDELAGFLSNINHEEIGSYQSQFDDAIANEHWEIANTMIYTVDDLRNHNNLAIESAEKMLNTFTEKRFAGWRALFDKYFDAGRYGDAEDMLQKLVVDNRSRYGLMDNITSYHTPVPEDIPRVEKLYRLMASRSCSLHRWGDAANYLNRLATLLKDETSEATEAGEIQKTRTAVKFLEFEAYLRSKNWDAASTLSDELSEMALPKLERACLALRKTQLKYWKSTVASAKAEAASTEDDLLRISAPVAISVHITVLQEVKIDCEEVIHLLGAITPEPAALKEAITLMVNITAMLNEILETEAYESLLPADCLVLGNRVLSTETTALLRRHNLCFDPITWECTMHYPWVVKALEAMKDTVTRELLEILLDDKFIVKCNTNLDSTNIPVVSSLLAPMACQRGDLELLKLFIDRGLWGFTEGDMLKWRGPRRSNPLLAHAIRSNNIQLVSYMYSKNWHPKEDMTMVVVAIGSGNFEVFKMMIDQGREAYGDLNAGISMASFTMADGGVADVILPVRGKTMGIGLTTWYPDTLLHFAILRKDIEMVNYLLKNGAGTGGRSLTALDWAIWVGHQGIMNMLHIYKARMSTEGQKVNKKYRSSYLNQKLPQSLGKLRTPPGTRWYCCKCGDGPLNCDTIITCPNCGHYPDSSCSMEAKREETPSRLENRHLPEQRL